MVQPLTISKAVPQKMNMGFSLDIRCDLECYGAQQEVKYEETAGIFARHVRYWKHQKNVDDLSAFAGGDSRSFNFAGDRITGHSQLAAA